MNAERLLAHYETISEATDAIARLRQFILELAIRGKLVAHSQNKESAGDFLKEIANIKGAVNSDSASEGEFRVPRSWRWSTIGDLTTKTGSGSTPRGGKQVYRDSGVPFLRSQNIHNDRLRLRDVVYIDAITHERMKGTAVAPGDLLLNITGGSIGRCCLVPRDPIVANISQHVAIIRPAISEMGRYLHIVVLSPYFQAKVVGEQTGAGRGGLPKNRMDRIAIPLPPLEEQHRIVAKVDALMALCDRLETARKDREERRNRVAAASFTRLGLPALETFPLHACITLSSLSALTTCPDHVALLRQTILSLGVQGKLVAQDTTDVPAAALLEEICKSNRVTYSSNLANTDVDLPFELPSGWKWAALPELGIFGRGRSKHRPRNDPSLFVGGQHLMIQTGDVARSGGFIQTHSSKYNDVGLAQSRKWPKGTLCITIAANIADTGILEFDACFPDSVVGFIPAPPLRSARYFEYFLRTAKAKLLEFAPATAQKNINLEILSQVRVPLPPLTEIERIVSRLDQLMALCDHLERSLVDANETRRRLLESLLAEALEGRSNAIAA